MLTAIQARERILSGKIEGNHEVIEDLDMSNCIIPAWPCWKFKTVLLHKAKIKKITGSFETLNCSESTLEEIDPAIQVNKNPNGMCADFSDCLRLKKVQGNFTGFTLWNRSGIEEIDPKTKFGIDSSGESAFFTDCKSLKKVQGNFAGFTIWSGSGITEIDPKTHFGVSTDGRSANFSSCHSILTYAVQPKGKVQGSVTFRVKAPTLPNMEF